MENFARSDGSESPLRKSENELPRRKMFSYAHIYLGFVTWCVIDEVNEDQNVPPLHIPCRLSKHMSDHGAIVKKYGCESRIGTGHAT
jgi:hypothetical protein